MHCPALVLVPAADCAEAMARLDAALAPFRDRELEADRDGSGRYDWYDVGGRFLNAFRGEACWAVQGVPRRLTGQIRHLIEPDGQWHDADPRSCWPLGPRGDGRAWECKEHGPWVAEVTEVLSAYPDHQAILVDLHH